MKKIRVKNYSNIFIGEYPFHQKLKDELVSLLEKYPDIQERKTNVKATMTEWNWDPESDSVKRLQDCVIAEIHSWCNYGLIGKSQPRLLFHEFWANIYHKGDYTQSHTHWRSPTLFSWVYFLKSKWYNSPLVFDESGKRIFPKEGTYVLFPSYFLHHVPKHRFNETRITLSGNLDILEP